MPAGIPFPMRLLVVLALIHGLVPAFGEVAEAVVHYATTGHLAHSDADEGDSRRPGRRARVQPDQPSLRLLHSPAGGRNSRRPGRPCGLFTATALNMVVVPALYLRFGSVRERIVRLAGRRTEDAGSRAG